MMLFCVPTYSNWIQRKEKNLNFSWPRNKKERKKKLTQNNDVHKCVGVCVRVKENKVKSLEIIITKHINREYKWTLMITLENHTEISI